MYMINTKDFDEKKDECCRTKMWMSMMKRVDRSSTSVKYMKKKIYYIRKGLGKKYPQPHYRINCNRTK